MYILIIALFLFGFNFTLWLVVAVLRLSDDMYMARCATHAGGTIAHDGVFCPYRDEEPPLTPKDVAVIVPAYNEAQVVADTIRSLLVLVPAEQIFVNTYGSSDNTADIARSFGVMVLNSRRAGKAKAEKLQNTVQILANRHEWKRFKAVLIVDADTRVDEHFLERALPYFRDPTVAAVAGYATTQWKRETTSFWSMYFVAYRERMYFYMQTIVKYAQTWRRTNVSPIVPGFASIYRVSVVRKVDINPPGLVIEDFNMTFEVHHKKLGKIAHHPSIFATTQDPDNFRDYVRQVRRWDLGFWQTLRRHGFWRSWFSGMLFVYITDIFFSSIIFMFLPLMLIVLAVPVVGPDILPVPVVGDLYRILRMFTSFSMLIFGVFIVDYLMTVIVAIAQRRPLYLLFGFGFLFLRIVDSFLYVVTLPQAFLVHSTGRWQSPRRR